MRRYLTALSLAALLCFSSILSAQDTATSGETFTDFAAFEAEVCGTIVGGDFAWLRVGHWEVRLLLHSLQMLETWKGFVSLTEVRQQSKCSLATP